MSKQKRYGENFKRHVVLEVLSGSITKEEARRRYEIMGKSTVLKWMRTFAGIHPKESGSDPIPILRTMKHVGKDNKDKDKEKEIRELRVELARLKSELEISQLKGRAYQIMVEIARERYNIDLEKKPGAKQSKPSKKRKKK